MGSVGSFQRIQEFLCTPDRLDSRRKPDPLDALSHHELKGSQNTVASTLRGGDSETEKSVAPTIPPEILLSSLDAVMVQEGSFGWDRKKEPLLKSINMRVPRGNFTMIVGPVGCGKSTLIKAVLGEAVTMEGSVQLSSLEVAFCDQTAWLMNGTVQQSIIGISELDERWYQTVVDACALDEDLHQLPRGDRTLVGSNGVALSGGQSQRIVSVL
jgi:ATP-binding cassette, subfamily C (CFTR/MRP), member 1